MPTGNALKIHVVTIVHFPVYWFIFYTPFLQSLFFGKVNICKRIITIFLLQYLINISQNIYWKMLWTQGNYQCDQDVFECHWHEWIQEDYWINAKEVFGNRWSALSGDNLCNSHRTRDHHDQCQIKDYRITSKQEKALGNQVIMASHDGVRQALLSGYKRENQGNNYL